MNPHHRLAPKYATPRADFGALAWSPAHERPFDYGTEAMVPLTRDWMLLLHAARRFERLYVQTRHTHARLILHGKMSQFAINEPQAAAIDTARAMHFSFQYWLRAWAVVQRCECCGSPGRVVVHNALGREFLQLCAPHTCDADTWADYVAAVALPEGARPPVEPVSAPAIPVAPARARRVAEGPNVLLPLFAALADERVAVRAKVRTAEAAHSRELMPFVRSVEGGVLTFGDARAVAQLALRAVRGLSLESHPHGPLLRVVGDGGALLLTISPAADAVAASVWSAALRDAFVP